MSSMFKKPTDKEAEVIKKILEKGPESVNIKIGQFPLPPLHDLFIPSKIVKSLIYVQPMPVGGALCYYDTDPPEAKETYFKWMLDDDKT